RWRRKHSLIPRAQNRITEASAIFLAQKRTQIIDGELLSCEWRRLHWKRLRRPRFFSRHVAGRNSALLDRPQGFSGDAIEHPYEALFTKLRDRVNGLAVVLDR